MTARTLAIAALLLLATGCENPNKLTQWHVKLIRPDGQVHRAWFVRSATEPQQNPLRGGQIELYYDQGKNRTSPTWQWRSTGLLAPTGWVFDCEAIDSEFGKSIVQP